MEVARTFTDNAQHPDVDLQVRRAAAANSDYDY